MKTMIQLTFACSVLGIAAATTQAIAISAEWTAIVQGENAAEKSTAVDESWITLAPDGARSSVRMPKKPRYIERSFSPVKDEPPIKVRLHLATVNEGLTTYVFGYHDLHEIPQTGKKVKEVLDWSVRGSVANVLGQLIADPQVIKYDSNLGRQFVYVCGSEKTRYIVTARIFLVGKRLYQVSCLMEENVFDKTVAEVFLDTFHLIPTKSDLPPRPKTTG
jgi:hypothetical protein